MEFGPLYGAHVGGVRLVQQDGEFAKYRAGLRDRGDLHAVSDNLDQTLPKNKQLPSRRPGCQYSFSGIKSRCREGRETLIEGGKVQN